jgi:hypothetical protein
MAKDFRQTPDKADKSISGVPYNVLIDAVVTAGYNRAGYK